MFNNYSYSGGNTNIKVNAVSGTLVKNYRKSFFLRFAIGSTMEDCLFSKNPRLQNPNGFGTKEVVVIQSMIIADKTMLAEVMWKDDFDEMFDCYEGRCEQ